MPKKEKKKSWNERRRERQIKQQRAQEAYQVQQEKEAKRKPRKWPKGKILFAVCVLVLILGAYGAWQLIPPPEPSDGSDGTPTYETIYIRFDGRVSPSTAPVLNVGNNHYTLTADVNTSIVVERDSVVIDGANHVLQGADAAGSRGIDLTGRSNVTVTNMEIRGFESGVYLSAASGNIVSQNDLKNNYCGVWIAASSNDNVVSGNTIASNEMFAIWLKESSGNKISENEITGHGNYTIYMGSADSTTVTANHIASNAQGIFLYVSSNNILYGNAFVDNVRAASNLDSTNIWDNGTEGNYWSDYGTKYPDAKELDSSGIWDTPYVIDENNQDNYPLMNR
jgi:parallel beta-helix repeat protein